MNRPASGRRFPSRYVDANVSRRPPFRDYIEPTLPADLPPGEAKREWPVEIWGATAHYPPPSAPGFQNAWRMGLLPSPPPTAPPTPVPGLTSRDRLWLAIAMMVGGFAFLPLLDAGDGAATVGCVLGMSALFLGGGWVLFGPDAKRRQEVEFAAGYTSTSAFTGLWRLARDGRVLRPPAPGVPPPGWYPSPYCPGLLQRWDGPGWHPLPEEWWRHPQDYFRAPQTPFL